MSYQACIDIGGTFTDCLVSDESGQIRIFKAPTTPGEYTYICSFPGHASLMRGTMRVMR